MPSLPEILKWLVIFVEVPIMGIVAIRLLLLLRLRPTNLVLKDRFLVTVTLIIVVIIFAAVFLNNNMEIPPLGMYQTQVLTRAAILSLMLTSIYWLWVYR